MDAGHGRNDGGSFHHPLQPGLRGVAYPRFCPGGRGTDFRLPLLPRAHLSRVPDGSPSATPQIEEALALIKAQPTACPGRSSVLYDKQGLWIIIDFSRIACYHAEDQ